MEKIRTRRLVAALLATILSCLTIGAQPYCNVRTFSTRHGLTANIISGMAQDANGLMWFSTYNGLCCYDGYRFISFRNAEGAQQLTTNRIVKIMAEGKAGIWLSVFDHHLYFFDTRTCRYVDFSSAIEKKTGQLFLARNYYTLDNGHTWIVNDETTTCLRTMGNGTIAPDSVQIITSRELPMVANGVKKVRVDKSGREWVITRKGVALYGSKVTQEGDFEHFAEVDGTTFLAESSGGLWQYDSKAQQLKRITLTPSAERINCIKEGPSGQLFIGTSNGVLIYDKTTGKTIVLAEDAGNVTNINADSHQRLWAFTVSGGIVLISQEKTSSSHQQWQSQQLSTAHFPPLSQLTTSAQSLWVEDQQGTVWMAPTSLALCYYDEEAEQLVPYPIRSQGYDYHIPQIRNSYIDHQHNLWLTTSQFLTLVNLKYHHMKVLPLRAGQDTRSLLTMPDGQVWAGSGDGIVGIYDAKGQVSGYLGRDGSVHATPIRLSDKIYALYRDTKGHIYIGTRGDGLYVLADGKMTLYSHRDNDAYSLSSNEIYDIDEDEQGHLWVATYGGGLNLVQQQTDGSLRFIHAANDMKQYPEEFRQIRRVTHDGKGAVILSTTAGLVTFSNHFDKPSAIRFYQTGYRHGDNSGLRTSDVMQTLVTRQGDVYVTTMGGCIQRINSNSLLQDNLKFYTPGEQHESNVLSLVEDGDGYVWAVRETLLNKYKPLKGLVAEYGANELGDHTSFTEAQPSFDAKSGQLALPTMGGVIVLHPNDLKKSNYKPGIVFTSVQFQGEAQRRPLLNMSVLEVPSDKRSLTINFSALDYQDNDLVQYAYKVEGIDKDWNYIGQSNQAQLSNLPPGRHRFIVKSTNSDGVWMENETAFYLNVSPTFWETTWAKVLYVLLAILVIGAIINFIVLRRKNALQHKMDYIKTRFYTDVSHQLRTPLTLIGGPVTEVLADEKTLSDKGRQHLEMVQRNARNMLELVNKMLEKLKSKSFVVDNEKAPVFAGHQSFQEVVTQKDDAIETKSGKQRHKDVKLLVVEDNDDLRAFLVSILHDDYTVIEAANGRKGLDKALHEQPDFIITDVMMPEMDGLTMVHQIKQNADICHIPIVVLSAKASLEDRLQGLKEGIDDYITKPFSATYLRQRIENIIAQRQMLQRTWLEQLGTNAEGTKEETSQREYRLEAPEIVDADQQMMDRLMQYLEERISDQDLRIEDMADAVNLGRTVFYGKIKSIVGMAPVDFLRHVRMQRAEDLISRSQMTIAEVAYAIGFTDPKYFTKCFKKETGMTPTEYRDSANQS